MFTTFATFLVRIAVSVATRTFFQPDEYFQALEPAHRAVFGYGHLTWEWMSEPPIRSVVFPGVWMPVYYALKVTGLDKSKMLIIAPKILSGIFAGLGDVYTGKVASQWLGEEYMTVAVVMSLLSTFNALALSRTLSNSLETSLTITAIYYWPFPGNRHSNYSLALCLAAVACMVRPTSAITWSFLGAELLWRTYRSRRSLRSVIRPLYSLRMLLTLSLETLDSFYYGKPTFTPLNFLRVNLSSVASFYGQNPWHYYLTQGVPVICGMSLPFVLHGAWLSYSATSPRRQTLRLALGLCLWLLFVYSCASHKEWRFIHPLLPIFHILAANSAVTLWRFSNRKSTQKRPMIAMRWKHLAIISCSLPTLIYVALFHSKAQIKVIQYLRDLGPEQLRSVGFLMPCHSTPWQAHLHRPEVEMWAIGCEPPLGVSDVDSYQDQTKVFYNDPVSYISRRFPASVDPSFPPSPQPSSSAGSSVPVEWKHSWPSHIASFGALTEDFPEIQGLLESKGYRKAWWSSNGWEEDERRKGGINIWEWQMVRQSNLRIR